MEAKKEEFECLVVGDEPAGIWLLSRLSEVLSAGFSKPSLGWIAFQKNPRPIPLALPISKRFGIEKSEEEAWSAQLCFPKQRFDWSPEALAKRFPGLYLPMELERGVHPYSQRLKDQVTDVLTQYPDLLFYSSGIWKYVCRTYPIEPLSQILGALACAQMRWWRPWEALPENVIHLRGDEPAESIEKIEVPSHPKDPILVELGGGRKLYTNRLVLNVDYEKLAELKPRIHPFSKVSDLNLKNRARYSLYPVDIQTDFEAVPNTLSPLTIHFAEHCLPDFMDEIWPLYFRKREASKLLTLYLSARSDSSLSEVLRRYRAGLQTLFQRYPFLHQGVRTFSLPLDIQSCSSDSYRKAAVDLLEARRVEWYAQTRLHPRARDPRVSLLVPSLHCHLPYPLGPLLGAEELIEAAIKKQNRRTKVRKTARKASHIGIVTR